MIGLQLGTLVAQVVIIGDLGPAIISKFTGIEVICCVMKAMITPTKLLTINSCETVNDMYIKSLDHSYQKNTIQLIFYQA